MVTLSQLREMGFTPTMIARLLPPPTLKPNPHYRSGPKMKLWEMEAVEAAKLTPEFQNALATREKRKAAAQKSTATKRANLLDQYARIAESIQIEVIPLDELERRAIDARQNWYDMHDPYCERDRCAYSADAETIARWMVNYIRHHLLSGYDNSVYALRGRTGNGETYQTFKAAVLEKIAIAYPSLAAECSRQINPSK